MPMSTIISFIHCNELVLFRLVMGLDQMLGLRISEHLDSKWSWQHGIVIGIDPLVIFGSYLLLLSIGLSLRLLCGIWWERSPPQLCLVRVFLVATHFRTRFPCLFPALLAFCHFSFAFDFGSWNILVHFAGDEGIPRIHRARLASPSSWIGRQLPEHNEPQLRS
jgi:hypothetical protein